MRRSILALVVIAGLVAVPVAPVLGACVAASPACDAICSAARVAVVPSAGVAIGLEPMGQAPSHASLHPSLLVLAVPQPPPKSASLFL
jgi:hypothetical protein